jgi:hypothetical protein
MVTVILNVTAGLLAMTGAIFGAFSLQEPGELYAHHAWLWSGLVAGLALGVATGLVSRIFEGQTYPRRVHFRQSPTIWLTGAAMFGLFASLGGQPVTAVLATLAAGLSASLAAGGSRSGGNDQRGLSPAALLLDDRTCALVAAAICLVFAAVTSFPLGFPGGFLVIDLLVIAGLWILLPTAAVTSGAWGQFCLARLVLALSRKTPLRLMGFLSEAHDRGVLRQAGGIYQFRHNLLQDHLAGVPATAPAAPAVL